jgi:hypothetical protein
MWGGPSVRDLRVTRENAVYKRSARESAFESSAFSFLFKSFPGWAPNKHPKKKCCFSSEESARECARNKQRVRACVRAQEIVPESVPEREGVCVFRA